MRGAALVVAALALGASELAAQDVRAGVSPDTGSVGSVVRVAVRVSAPPGARVLMPDTLSLGEHFENSGRRRDRVDTLTSGATQVTAVYPITAWRPGVHPLPPVIVEIVAAGAAGAERADTVPVSLPTVTIRSVLPKDTAGAEPKPAKAVVGRNWMIWPFIIGGLLLLAAIALLVRWWILRRRRRPFVPVPAAPPRERALAALDHIRASDLLRAGGAHAFYGAVSEVLRRFLAETDPRLGVELTTTELAGVLPASTAAATASELLLLLRDADLVKFARLRPETGVANAFFDRARAWVADFQPASAAEEEREAA